MRTTKKIAKPRRAFMGGVDMRRQYSERIPATIGYLAMPSFRPFRLSTALVALARVGVALVLHGALSRALQGQSVARPRARDVGVVIGVFDPGPVNAITDGGGVRVGDTIHTGVTAILPHGGNVFRERVPAALFVLNGFGKLIGSTELQEHGELETPILLTCTLCVWKAADAMAAYLLDQPDMRTVRSISPVVGETNDGGLSDIRA